MSQQNFTLNGLTFASTSSNIVFGDGTVQTTAYTGATGPVGFTGSAGTPGGPIGPIGPNVAAAINVIKPEVKTPLVAVDN